MKVFGLHHTAFDKVPFDFLGGVALRSLYTSVLVSLSFRMAGRRSVWQTSLFEASTILMLESATGDMAFYDDMPMIPVLIVFTILTSLYRLVMWLAARNGKLEGLLGGKPVVIIEDGELAWSKFSNPNMMKFEFFIELRLRGAEQLGQVRLTILGTSGQISVYFFEGDKVKPGLLILLSDCTQCYKAVPEPADYVCIHCSEIVRMRAEEKQLCPRCANPE